MNLVGQFWGKEENTCPFFRGKKSCMTLIRLELKRLSTLLYHRKVFCFSSFSAMKSKIEIPARRVESNEIVKCRFN